MRNLKLNLKKLIALGGTVLVLATTTACGKKADCNIDTYHAHQYVNEEGYIRYIDKEYLNYEGYARKEEYIELDESEKDLYKYLDKKDLLRIDDNIDTIIETQEANKNFTEYRYAYTYLMPIPIVHSTGKTTYVTFMFIPTTHYSWTRDANHSRLTGETRECTYEYTAYKIEKDENGKYVLIPSPEHKNILATKDEFPYIKEDYYRVINLTDGCEASYEDMETDDVEHIEEETVTEDNNLELTR